MIRCKNQEHLINQGIYWCSKQVKDFPSCCNNDCPYYEPELDGITVTSTSCNWVSEKQLAKYDELKVWNIVKQYPEELGMILECKNYEEYKQTFSDIDCEDEIEITEEQFYIVKNFFNKQEPKEIIIDQQPLVDNCCAEGKGLHDGIKCPYCGECYYREDYSTSTCMYCPPIIKDGKLISDDANTTTTHCHCLNCGEDFSIVHTHGKTVIRKEEEDD